MTSLKIKLLPGWKPVSNPGGPATYTRGTSANEAALQFSVGSYKHGMLPHTSGERLIAMCEKLGSKVKDGRVVSRSSGECAFGSYGTVVIEGASPAHFQAWVVSNKTDFILITHVSPSKVDPKEAEEAHEIALMTSYQ